MTGGFVLRFAKPFLIQNVTGSISFISLELGWYTTLWERPFTFAKPAQLYTRGPRLDKKIRLCFLFTLLLLEENLLSVPEFLLPSLSHSACCFLSFCLSLQVSNSSQHPEDWKLQPLPSESWLQATKTGAAAEALGSCKPGTSAGMPGPRMLLPLPLSQPPLWFSTAWSCSEAKLCCSLWLVLGLRCLIWV